MLKHYLTKAQLLLVLFLCCGMASIQAQATLSVEGVGDIYALRALFGPNFDENISAEIVLATDAEAPESDACTEITNVLNGKIALIDRGACNFTIKALNAQAAGAIAVVICNNDAANPNLLFFPAGNDMGQLTIPTVGITFGACGAIKTALEGGGVNATLIPSFNNLCTEATAIEPGTYMVDSIYADPVLSGLGGAPSHPDDGDATAAVWYSYTPPADGLMTVSSCEGGADTRLWISIGSCDAIGLTLNTVVGNDDACIFDPTNLEDEYASFVSLPVQGGVTYYIEWDDRWENGPFTFSLEFEEMIIVLDPGQVCDSAIVIQPGTYTIDTISPYGQTGEYNINGSEWYSFTPEFTGLMSLSSCGQGVNTRLIVHQGDCLNLEEVAFSDNACESFDGDSDELAAAVEGIPVLEGNTYLIEWSGRRDASGFDFTLTLDSLPTVAVTFTVDMSLQTVGEDGVQLLWTTNAPDDLNGLNIDELTDEDGDNRWTTTLEFTALDTISYAFANGGLDSLLANVETVPEECSVSTNFGFNVRQFVVASEDAISVDVVCFGFCRSCGPENCEEPFTIISDDFENYQSGALGPQSDDWSTWSGTEGGNEDGIVSDEQASSGTQSMKIEGDNGPQDVLLLLGDQTSGHYILSWKMYVPSEKQGYYNIQKFEGEPGEEFGLQATFGTDGILALDIGGADAIMTEYAQDEWIDIEHYIDLNNNDIRLYVDGSFVYAWPFNWESFLTTGTKQLGSIDFFPAAGESLFYIDDVLFAEIPPAGEGQYAHTAVSIDEGTYTVPSIECFGAGFQTRTNGNGGAGYWYEYEASADGYITVSTCGGGIDTRLWVFSGGSQNLNILGVNDDLCPIVPGDDAFASYREVPVKAGESYLIVFDNVWESEGFEWSLDLIEGELPAGDFCESAIAIEAGTITIDTLNGNAAVAGPSIGISSGSSFTPYANAEWYSFTAPEDGTMSVYTCEVTPEATNVYIYDGSCGIDDLNLIGTDANGCDPSSTVRGISVTAGTTYYIEWASKFDGDRPGFDFVLEFGNPAVVVTFKVDMSILASNGELSGQGAYIGGEFNNFATTVMEEDITENNVYTYEVSLVRGDTVEYNFYNGPVSMEEIDLSFGDNCVLDAFGSRFIIVGEQDTTLMANCFGFCVPCIETGIENTLFAQSLKVFPNPAQERTTLQYQFEQPTDLVIQLSNALGQIVSYQEIDQALSGNEQIELKGLPTGIYQLIMTSGERVKTEVLMVE